jgi:hypothetical protein
MLKHYHIILIINILNIKLFSLTLPYDVVMMYCNYIKNDGKKYNIHKIDMQILQT